LQRFRGEGHVVAGCRRLETAEHLRELCALAAHLVTLFPEVGRDALQ